MNVDCGSDAEELMNSRKIKVSFPPARGGASKNNVRDVLFVHELRDRFRYAFARHLHYRRSHILSEAKIRVQSLLIGFTGVLAHVGVDDKKFPVDGFSHARSTGDQVLSSGIRTDADGDALPNRDGPVVESLLTMLLQAAVHGLSYLTEG